MQRPGGQEVIRWREIGKMLVFSHGTVVKIIRRIRVEFSTGLPRGSDSHLYG